MATITGTSGDDIGDNRLIGTSEDDQYFGLEGEDQLVSSEGNDTLDGGGGNEDRADYSSDPAGILANLADGTVTDGFGDTDVLVGIEQIAGSDAFGDIIIGGVGDGVWLEGQGGNDQITNNNPGQLSILIGGDGNDTITSASGIGFIRPGVGNDTVSGSTITDFSIAFDIISYFLDLEAADPTPINGVSVVFTDVNSGTIIDYAGGIDVFTGVDRIEGTMLADTFIGSEGNQRFQGRGGNDTIDGGGTNDIDRVDYSRPREDQGGTNGIIADLAAGTVVDTFGDTDTIINIEAIIGTPFGDSMLGGADDDTLEGLEGDDTLNGGDGSDNVDGGAGHDTLTDSSGGAFFQPGSGDDLITGGASASGFYFLSYIFSSDRENASNGISVTFTGERSGTVQDYSGGTDVFTGVDRVEGTMFADTFSVTDGRLNVRAQGGNDTITGGEATNDFVDYSRPGDQFGDISGISADLGSGTIVDPYGDIDTITNVENIRGTDFSDQISGNESSNRLNGRDGDDTLLGRDGNDELDGGAGDDDLRGNDGDDTLLGGDGRDELYGGAGNDTLDGGAGDRDEARYDSASGAVSVDLGSGTASDGDGGTDTLIGIEEARGGQFNDTLVGGSDGNYYLKGQSGDDLLTNIAANANGSGNLDGGFGNDTLISEAGEAFFQPGIGDDSVTGSETGFDFLSYLFSAASDTTMPTNGIAVTFSGEHSGTVNDYSGSTDTFTEIELLGGTILSDSFTGGEGNQRFRGYGGDDTLDGGAGDGDFADYSRPQAQFGALSGIIADLSTGTVTDAYGDTDTLISIERLRGTDFDDQIDGGAADEFFEGQDGDDVIAGADGNDIIEGDDGADTISGGAGDDTLTGGNGADVFVITQGDESVQITDFEIGVDRLDLTSFARADALAAFNGAQAGSAILTFSDGTVLTVDGQNVTPETLTLDDVELAPSNSEPTGNVVISGDAELGGTLTADISGLADADGIRTETITYQWQRNGSDIAGSAAQNATYVVTEDDILADLSVLVSFTDEGDTDEQVSSATVMPLPTGLLINGDETSEQLDGGLGEDTVNGNGGDDTITAGAGDDQIDGGEGSDTSVYSADKASHTVTLSSSSISLEDRRTDGDGTDQLTSIESLSFLDTDWPLAIFSGVGGLTEQAFRDFIEVYIAYFNRAPDAEGLFFYGTAFANGTSLEDSAATFLNSAEYQATYPPGLTNQEFAEAVYNNVLGRIPDVLGLEFWVGVLDSGARSRDVFILEVLKGAKAPAPNDATQDFLDQKAADVAYLSNKTDVGLYFAVTKGMSNVTNATTAMQLFDDGDQADIDAAVAAIDGFYADALDPTDGEFLLQLVGVVDDPFMV